MEKTTVYLTADQKAALARTAAAQGRSEARLVRAGIDIVTAGHRAAESTPTLDASPPDRAAVAGASGAALAPGRPRWLGRDAFVRAVLRHQADPALGREIRELAPDMTDEMRLP